VHTAEYVFDKTNEVPRCERIRCNGIVKPEVVLYEEMLDEQNLINAVDAISNADLLIVARNFSYSISSKWFDKLF
jgi:NAD-dependent deacetylase